VKKSFLLLNVLLLLLVQRNYAEQSLDLSTFYYTKDQVALAKEVITILENDHFLKKSFDSIQNEAFELYLERLDPNKNIFLANEIQKFKEDIKNKLDIKDNLEIAYLAFKTYAERYQMRFDIQIEFLNNISDQDIRSSKRIVRDRSKADNLNVIEELRTLWKDLILNDVIQLMLSGNSLEDSAEKTLKRIKNQLNYFKQTRNEDVFNIYINSISSIYGPHTSYMSPKNSEDFDINMSLSLEGIGALLSPDGPYTSISSLIPGGPAEKSGLLKPKDKIIGVGQDDDKEIVDVVGWRLDDVVELIRGPKNSKVRLEIIPGTSLDDSETKEIEIIRSLVKLEDQAAEKKVINVERGYKTFKIGVIELPAFYFDFEAYQKRDYSYRSSSKDVKKLLRELNNDDIEGLILDLRNNGGGSLYEANALAHLFIGRGTTVQVKDSKGNIQGLGERWGYQFFDKPLLVLVNKFSASASEILAGAIQDYNRGIIVGTDTFGKGTVQRVDMLSAGQLKFTESKFYRVSGSSTQNKGVNPDIKIPASFDIDEIGESKLDRALEHDSIPTAYYRNFNRVGSYIDLLKEKSNERISNSLFFQSMDTRKEWRKANDITFLDLHIDKRKKVKEGIENFVLLEENELRRMLELPTYENYQDFLDRDEDPDSLNIDFNVLDEAANILSDLIEVKSEPLLASTG
jgi:carboxyl-terminal processing protease